jgi:hypothetical protein
MGLECDEKITDLELGRVFIGSCAETRIEDLRPVTRVADGKTVKTMVVLASSLVKSGLEWREPGCARVPGIPSTCGVALTANHTAPHLWPPGRINRRAAAYQKPNRKPR